MKQMSCTYILTLVETKQNCHESHSVSNFCSAVKEIQLPFDRSSRACPSASEMPRLRSVAGGHLPTPLRSSLLHTWYIVLIFFADYRVRKYSCQPRQFQFHDLRHPLLMTRHALPFRCQLLCPAPRLRNLELNQFALVVNLRRQH